MANAEEKKSADLIAALRARLLELRTVPFTSVNQIGAAAEWNLRDLEKALRIVEAKYEYAKSAATQLYKTGAAMRQCQRRYFKDRTYANLEASKDAERTFDAVMAAVQSHGKPQQAFLPLAGKEDEVRHG